MNASDTGHVDGASLLSHCRIGVIVELYGARIEGIFLRQSEPSLLPGLRGERGEERVREGKERVREG